jgi:hypothetical protein
MVEDMFGWPVNGVVRRLEKLGRWSALKKARAVLEESLFLVVPDIVTDMHMFFAIFEPRNFVSVFALR